MRKLLKLAKLLVLCLLMMQEARADTANTEASSIPQKILISGGYTGPIKEYFEDILRQFNASQSLYKAEFVGAKDYMRPLKKHVQR